MTFKPIQSYITHLLVYYLLKITIYTTVWPIPLCGCGTSSPTLSEDHRLGVYGDMVLRKICGPKRDEVTTGMEEIALCGASSFALLTELYSARGEVHIGFW